MMTSVGYLVRTTSLPSSQAISLAPSTGLIPTTLQLRMPEDRRPRKLNRSSGCLKCRIRKKKCDGRKPTCLGCERNILLCNWPEDVDESSSVRRSRQVPGSKSSKSMSPHESYVLPSRQNFSADKKLGIAGSMTINQQPGLGVHILQNTSSSMLYEHWIKNTGNALSVLQGHRNAFVTELPKLALHYPDIVLQGMLALSGVHYCNRNKNNTIQQLTYTHLAQAFQAMKYGLTRHVSEEDDNALPLLVTTLIFCFIETTGGDITGNLRYHLRAAQPLLLKVLRSKIRPDQPMLEFLKEYYAYISYITDLSTDLEVPYPDLDTSSGAEPLTSDKSSGVLLGCAHHLFELIPRISSLVRRQRRLILIVPETRAEQKTLEEETHIVLQRQLEMESCILGWEPPNKAEPDLKLCGRIYQQALFVYNNPAFQPSRSTCHERMLRIEQEIGHVITLLDLLPLNAPISATLVWPLAYLGTLATDVSHREAIRGRLEAIWSILGLGNVKATVDFLDRCWSDDLLEVGTCPSYHNHLEGLMERYDLHLSFV